MMTYEQEQELNDLRRFKRDHDNKLKAEEENAKIQAKKEAEYAKMSPYQRQLYQSIEKTLEEDRVRERVREQLKNS